LIKQIAILRGINVGGRRKILMSELKELLKELGLKEIETYIQSGNVIFSTKSVEENFLLEEKIESSIKKRFNFDVPVIIRTVDELKKTILENPFTNNEEIDINCYYLTLLKKYPELDNIEKIERYDFSPDQFKIIDRDAYIYCSGRYSDTKLQNQFFESKLQVQTTTRNWKTILKLIEIAES
jgi:uncharacterized protein (DUF1697 family)